MGTSISCPECGKSYRFSGAVPAGRRVKCKVCSHIFTIGAKGAGETDGMQDLVGRTIGGCRIENELGRGAMGAVFRAHHVALDIPVAVKILPPHFASRDRRLVDRFIREARAAARLKHHHIVSVLNVGDEEGLYFIVMEFVDGENLRARLERTPQLDFAEAVRITGQVCDALELARVSKVVHRDIKPDNILLDRKGQVKLADLGLAKTLEEDHSITQSGATIGTPHYMSPEQAEDAASADHRSDIYALGCTLYHMLCGQPPFQGGSVFQILRKHVQAPLPDPRPLRPDLPEALVAILQRMLAKAPAERYQAAADLQVDLDAADLTPGEDAAAAEPEGPALTAPEPPRTPRPVPADALTDEADLDEEPEAEADMQPAPAGWGPRLGPPLHRIRWPLRIGAISLAAAALVLGLWQSAGTAQVEAARQAIDAARDQVDERQKALRNLEAACAEREETGRALARLAAGRGRIETAQAAVQSVIQALNQTQRAEPGEEGAAEEDAVAAAAEAACKALYLEADAAPDLRDQVRYRRDWQTRLDGQIVLFKETYALTASTASGTSGASTTRQRRSRRYSRSQDRSPRASQPLDGPVHIQLEGFVAEPDDRVLLALKQGLATLPGVEPDTLSFTITPERQWRVWVPEIVEPDRLGTERIAFERIARSVTTFEADLQCRPEPRETPVAPAGAPAEKPSAKRTEPRGR